LRTPAARTAPGSGAVYERDGIRHQAPPDDWTNQWLLEVASFVYDDTSPNATYKPEACADVLSYSQRCHWRSNYWAAHPDLAWHSAITRSKKGLALTVERGLETTLAT
jgi:hypothetical protein